MISKNTILGKLTPFLNKESVVVDNQGVNDIITGILKTHSKYLTEYDKIYPYFIGSDLQETSKNIFSFLKSNVPYFIESNDLQYLKSPASILSTTTGSNGGSDCKSYALFTCGVMDAIRRNTGEDIEINYRFASYDPFDKVPQHVFCVVRGEGEEFWIDPVLGKFNEKKQPYFYKDKNVNKMALVGLSGVQSQQQKVGSITDIFNSILKATPDIIKALPSGQQTQYPTTPYYQAPQTQTSTGISTNTLLLIGGVGIAAYFLLFKKK